MKQEWPSLVERVSSDFCRANFIWSLIGYEIAQASHEVQTDNSINLEFAVVSDVCNGLRLCQARSGTTNP